MKTLWRTSVLRISNGSMPRSTVHRAAVRPLWVQLSDIRTAITNRATILEAVFNMAFLYRQVPRRLPARHLLGRGDRYPAVLAFSVFVGTTPTIASMGPTWVRRRVDQRKSLAKNDISPLGVGLRSQLRFRKLLPSVAVRTGGNEVISP